jgi:hypothetical protein
MVESLSAGPEAVARYGRAIARFEPFFEQAAERSPYRERLPEQLSWAVVGGIVGFVYRVLARREEELLPDLLPKLVYFTIAPYLGADAALEAVEATRTASPR